jgi:hypothetical protein
VVASNSGTFVPSVFKVMLKVFTEGTYNVLCTYVLLILVHTYIHTYTNTYMHTYVRTHMHTCMYMPNLVGEDELHLGNIPCGGHRTHNYRSADKIKNKLMVSQSLHVYCHCLFH